MNCSNCGAALSVGTETHLLNCAFCGAVQRNPDSEQRRPIDDLLDQVFAETGDPAFEVRRAEEAERKVAPATIGAVAGRPRETLDANPPEAREARRETRQALNDIFGDEVGAAPATATAVAAERVVAPEMTDVAAPSASPFATEPAMPERRHRPHVILGGDPHEPPEWTRHLIPFLVLALLAGAGVAGLTALILG